MLRLKLAAAASTLSLLQRVTLFLLRWKTKSNFVFTALVVSKPRVAPSQQTLTILGMVLLGDFILSKLLIAVIDSFKVEIDISQDFLQSDSKVTSAWMKAPKRIFQTFAQNQIMK